MSALSLANVEALAFTEEDNGTGNSSSNSFYEMKVVTTSYTEEVMNGHQVNCLTIETNCIGTGNTLCTY